MKIVLKICHAFFRCLKSIKNGIMCIWQSSSLNCSLFTCLFVLFSIAVAVGSVRQVLFLYRFLTLNSAVYSTHEGRLETMCK